jgi:hypothetical protein
MPLNLCQNIFPNYLGDTFIEKKRLRSCLHHVLKEVSLAHMVREVDE